MPSRSTNYGDYSYENQGILVAKWQSLVFVPIGDENSKFFSPDKIMP
jgi:hypothetical protein